MNRERLFVEIDLVARFRLRINHRHITTKEHQSHHEINENMRGILVDWLVEVSRRSPIWPPVIEMCVRFKKVSS